MEMTNNNAVYPVDIGFDIQSKISLYKKIANVMRKVEYLNKDDKVAFGNTRYNAISEEKVTTACRNAMLEEGLVILPVTQAVIKEDIIKADVFVGFITTVNTLYKLIDIDTGAYEYIASSGSGVDTQDKGVGKAMTYAFKYALLRSFAIPTGEDPDKIASEQIDDDQKKIIEGTKPSRKKHSINVADEEPDLILEKFPGSTVVKTKTAQEWSKEVFELRDAIVAEKKMDAEIVDSLIASYGNTEDKLITILHKRLGR